MKILRENILSFLVIASIISYSFYRQDLQYVTVTKEDGVVGVLPKVTDTPKTAPKTTPKNKSGGTSQSQTPAISTPVPTPTPRGPYRDGTYVGDLMDAYYGDMQVSVDISGGYITAVNALKHPGGNSNSQRINSRAIPILKQEAIKAQSANIDAVSGASYSSPAFINSLASALDQAKI